LPWVTKVVPWSPAAIWPSFVDQGADKKAALIFPAAYAGGHVGFQACPRRGGCPAGQPELPGARRSFFYGGFDWQTKLLGMSVGGGKAQAEFWYRDNWECKKMHLRMARLDRHETYDHKFRLWHWRLGLEQLVFSHQIKRNNEPLYLSNTKRTLLLCGMEDSGGDLCAHTRDVASNMTKTPGSALFLVNTGHSISNERPNFLAKRIADFL